jgi:hypothetical protein
LFDAYHVPKFLSQQLLLFGRSGDELEELTFGVEQFFASVREARTVHMGLADSPWVLNSSRVHRVLARLRFRSGFVLGFCCSWFADGPSFSSRRSGSRADDPPGLRGQAVFLGSVLVVLLAFTDCPRHLVGRFAWPLRTVCGSWPDCPRGPCGQFAPPGRTIRQRLAALFLGSIPPFLLSCFRVCFKESFPRLEVDPQPCCLGGWHVIRSISRV